MSYEERPAHVEEPADNPARDAMAIKLRTAQIELAHVTEYAEESRRDAERYRFLRSEAVNTDPHYYVFWQEFNVKLCREEKMDALIDATMKEVGMAAAPEPPASEPKGTLLLIAAYHALQSLLGETVADASRNVAREVADEVNAHLDATNGRSVLAIRGQE